MKSTGVIRRIDELGRIVIPKEIRRNLQIRDGETLEIFIENDSIILRKHSIVATAFDMINKLGSLTNDIMNYSLIITDREKIIYISDKNLEIIKGKNISAKLINYIDGRECYNSKEEITLSFDELDLKGYFSISPIISSNDSIGLIILYSKEKMNIEEEKYSKLLAKLIGEKTDIA